MTELASPTSNPPTPPVAIFGIDEAGRFHASQFPGDEAELAAKAAELMSMHLLSLAGPECEGIAEKLAKGRIFPATGKAFVPFCKQPLYERLASLGGIESTPPAPKTPKPAKVARDAGKGAAKADAGKKSSKLAAPSAQPAPEVAPREVPTDWLAIRAGSLVLATSGAAADGWFESVVVEAKADDLMVLRWRDFPDEALFLRRRDQLALLPAGTPLTETS